MEGRDFHFPFKPYGIQTRLMAALYECIDEGKIGIFESPTGLNIILVK
jgi:chromosome transmission fidelity protein 1